MTAAPGLSAEPQHEPAPVDATSEASVSTEQQQHQQLTPRPPTGELLDRVAIEISQAFQSSLVQVVSDIGRDYGVELNSKFEWMEKGGAAVAPYDEQLLRNDDGDSDDVRRILRELQLTRLHARQLQRNVDGLREQQRISQQRVALFGTLSTKLKRNLVDERLALMEAKNEIKELRRRRSEDGSGQGVVGSRSPQSSSLQEQSDNLWKSPNKPSVGCAGSASGSGTTGGASEGSNLMGFSFYPSASSRSTGDHVGADNDDSPSTSSSTQTLRSTLMGQFLPSALLDSPQMVPKHDTPFAVDTLNEEKIPPPVFKLMDDIESLSLTSPPLPEALPPCSTVQQQGTYDVTGDEQNETSQGNCNEKMSTHSAVSPLKVSMLSELFDAIPIEELEMILQQSGGLESAAIDNILRSHPSLNPGIEAAAKAESSVLMVSPSLPPSVGHSKTSLRRSSQSGPSGAAPGPSSNRKTETCMYYMQGKCNKTRRTCSFAHGENDLARPTGSNSGSSTTSKRGPTCKTRLCQAYENGTCTKSCRECTMAHGANDLRDGSIASGAGVSSQTALPSATPRLQNYKTELCYYFLKGNCNYVKEECRFAHGQNDLRTVESNTAQIAAASSSGFSGDFGITSPAPPPATVTMEKQLQLQYQYQQQYHQQHHQPPSMTPFQPQPPPAPQPSFVPQHQIQLQHSSRGAGGAVHHQFGFQHQQYDMTQQQQQQYMPPPGQYRYLKNKEDKRPASVGRPPRRDSGSSWSSFDASGLPPSEY